MRLATAASVVMASALACAPGAPRSAAITPCLTQPPGGVRVPAAGRDEAGLTVFAAASLGDAFEDLREPWEAMHPGSQLAFSFDASSALRAQIEQGAPVDVFASADTRNAQLLVDACLAAGPPTPFAANALVIVVPAGNPASIDAVADLASPGLRIVAAGPDVPITRYAKELLDQLAAGADDPAAFLAAVAANTVSEEDNVRAVLAKVELGEADAAIVYATDAASTASVELLQVPATEEVVATTAAVAVAATREPALAAAFVEFLLAADAQTILREHGFRPPPEPSAE